MHRQNNITDMDERSFRRFVELYSSDLLYYARYLVHSKEAAEEIVSDVFFEVWQIRGKLTKIKKKKPGCLLSPIIKRSPICVRIFFLLPPFRGMNWEITLFPLICRHLMNI